MAQQYRQKSGTLALYWTCRENGNTKSHDPLLQGDDDFFEVGDIQT